MIIKKKNQRGEIATLLTLISMGLMLVGTIVGNVAVQKAVQTQSKAKDDTFQCLQTTCADARLPDEINNSFPGRFNDPDPTKSLYYSEANNHFYIPGETSCTSDNTGVNNGICSLCGYAQPYDLLKYCNKTDSSASPTTPVSEPTSTAQPTTSITGNCLTDGGDGAECISSADYKSSDGCPSPKYRSDLICGENQVCCVLTPPTPTHPSSPIPTSSSNPSSSPNPTSSSSSPTPPTVGGAGNCADCRAETCDRYEGLIDDSANNAECKSTGRLNCCKLSGFPCVYSLDKISVDHGSGDASKDANCKITVNRNGLTGDIFIACFDISSGGAKSCNYVGNEDNATNYYFKCDSTPTNLKGAKIGACQSGGPNPYVYLKTPAGPTVPPGKVAGNVTDFCTGGRPECLKWDPSGKGRTSGDKYCCDLCGPTEYNEWNGGACYQPKVQGQNVSCNQKSTTYNFDMGIGFPLRCLADTSDKDKDGNPTWKWTNINPQGQCVDVCPAPGVGTPYPTPPPGANTTPAPPQKGEVACTYEDTNTGRMECAAECGSPCTVKCTMPGTNKKGVACPGKIPKCPDSLRTSSDKWSTPSDCNYKAANCGGYKQLTCSECLDTSGNDTWYCPSLSAPIPTTIAPTIKPSDCETLTGTNSPCTNKTISIGHDKNNKSNYYKDPNCNGNITNIDNACGDCENYNCSQVIAGSTKIIGHGTNSNVFYYPDPSCIGNPTTSAKGICQEASTPTPTPAKLPITIKKVKINPPSNSKAGGYKVKIIKWGISYQNASTWPNLEFTSATSDDTAEASDITLFIDSDYMKSENTLAVAGWARAEIKDKPDLQHLCIKSYPWMIKFGEISNSTVNLIDINRAAQFPNFLDLNYWRSDWSTCPNDPKNDALSSAAPFSNPWYAALIQDVIDGKRTMAEVSALIAPAPRWPGTQVIGCTCLDEICSNCQPLYGKPQTRENI